MAFTYGAYTACLQDRGLEEVLDILAANGLTGAEVNVGGFIPSPRRSLAGQRACPPRLSGPIRAAGHEALGPQRLRQPAVPTAGVGPKHSEDVYRAIDLAAKLGVEEIVTMSGCPGSDPDAKYPSWVVNPWNGVDMDILDYQWSVLVPFWQQVDRFAAERGVKVCWELHPHNVIFNIPTFERFVAEAGTTNIYVNLDLSHLFWQQMDPLAVIPRLGGHIGHVHAKDTKIFPGAAYRGVLDTSFTRVPADSAGKVPTGIGFWCNAWPEDPVWRFVAVGEGHDVAYWTEFLRALQQVNPGLNINIEHEDAAYGQEEGLAVSAKTLLAAAAGL